MVGERERQRERARERWMDVGDAMKVMCSLPSRLMKCHEHEATRDAVMKPNINGNN